MDDDSRFPPLDLEAAAAVLNLPAAALDALAAGGYLAATRGPDGTLLFGAPDLKAFVARNADNGSGSGLLDRVLDGADRVLDGADRVLDGADRVLDGADRGDAGAGRVDMKPEELLELLDERAELMARRVLMMFTTIYPDAARWTDRQKLKFVQRTKSRFESVLAVAALGTEIEESVYQDLRGIGAAAAHSSTDLRRLLVILRMSRDLVVQNAVELADADGRHGTHALSLLLTRILPAMDRISDALSNGYWEALFAS